MRIGKPVEHLQAAVKSLDVSDPVLKLTALGRQLGYATYLFNDMLVWVSPFSYLRPHRTRTLTLLPDPATAAHRQGPSLLRADLPQDQPARSPRVVLGHRALARERRVQARRAAHARPAARARAQEREGGGADG